MNLSMNRQKVLFILITAVLLFGLLLLAASLSNVELSPGQTYNLSSLLGDRGTPAVSTSGSGSDVAGRPSVFIKILFWAGVVVAIIYAFVSPQYRQRVLGAVIAIAIFLLLRTVIGQRLAKLQKMTVGEASVGGDLSSTPSLPEPPAFVTNPPDWIIWVVAGAVAFLLVMLGIYVWRLGRQKKVEPDRQFLFVQEAAQALQELDAGGNLKDVVLRCYLQMEGVMRQSQNMQRQQSMTPREFEEHLVKAGFSDDHIGRLVRLFEEVRYGERPSDVRAEREARDCLTAIVAAYG